MRRAIRLPARFPTSTKYVLEARGPWVHRYVEFPDGRKVHLGPRKALSCACTGQMLAPSLAPADERGKRAVAAA